MLANGPITNSRVASPGPLVQNESENENRFSTFALSFRRAFRLHLRKKKEREKRFLITSEMLQIRNFHFCAKVEYKSGKLASRFYRVMDLSAFPTTNFNFSADSATHFVLFAETGASVGSSSIYFTFSQFQSNF